MPSVCAIPLFLSIYVGIVLGLVAWGYLQIRRSEFNDVLTWRKGTCVLLALLLLAALTTGMFLGYVVLDIGF